ncbi:MAG: hypothetical protein K2L76_00710 [Muribaculaceae bacterium]|nr:hypothetical protein [Muribaculaceae bacterium]
MSKKIICIGECGLDIVFGADGMPLGAMPGGRLANAAALLARGGLPVVVAGEAAADAVGDTVVAFLADAGADTHCVDRFTEGRTPVTIFMPAADGHMTATRYEAYAEECFDIVWPRIDEGDIVLFGGYYAIDRRMRARMLPLLQHAEERKAVLVYLPGFMPQQEPRITRVMPAILENLELAHMACTRSADLQMIFGGKDAEACYKNHIGFYCSTLLNVDAAARTLTLYSRGGTDTLELPLSQCTSLIWNAGAAAGAVKALHEAEATPELTAAAPKMLRDSILRQATATADTAVAALAADWQRAHE